MTVVPRSTGTEAAAQDLSSYTGHELYARFCAACHALDARGDGILASDLSVVPDLTRLRQRYGGAFPANDLRQIIDGRTTPAPHGTRAMPVWGYRFQESEVEGPAAAKVITRIIEYLRSIQVK